MLKEIEDKIKVNKRNFEKKKEILEMKRLEYHKAACNTDNAIVEYESIIKTKELSEEKKIKLITKINQVLKECKDAEKAYRIFTYTLREERTKDINVTKSLLKECQNIEEQRIELLKNTMLSLIKREESLISSKEINLEDSYNTVKEVDKKNEVKMVIKALDPNVNYMNDIKFHKIVIRAEKILEKYDDYYTRGNLTLPFNFEAARLSLQADKEDTPQTVVERTGNILGRILDNCWNEKKLTNNELTAFRDIIKDKEARQIFCNCLNCYRKAGLFCLTKTAFSYVVDLLKESLVQIDAEQDIDCALSLIVLSQTFYCERKVDGKSIKIYLQQGVADNEMFKRKEFWEKVLEQPLTLEGGINVVEEETVEEKKFREENEVFVKLGTYSHNMLQFGLPKELVEEIAFAYAEKKLLSKGYTDAIHVKTSVNM